MCEKFNDIIDAENLNEQQILDLYSDIIEMSDDSLVATEYKLCYAEQWYCGHDNIYVKSQTHSVMGFYEQNSVGGYKSYREHYGSVYRCSPSEQYIYYWGNDNATRGWLCGSNRGNNIDYDQVNCTYYYFDGKYTKVQTFP